MVSTTLVSPNIIKPKLRRSIPFGAPYVYAYRYEKLIHDSQSLIGSIGSCDSIRGSSGAFRDVDVPIADESTSYGSISSIWPQNNACWILILKNDHLLSGISAAFQRLMEPNY